MRTSRLTGLLLVPVLAFGLAACGNGHSGDKLASQTAKKADEATAMRNFAKCMREHGVDMPDPDGDGHVTMRMTGKPGAGKGPENDTGMQTAQKACQHLMPNGGKPKKPTAAELDKMRKFARCMRDHGINMPDPNADGGITIKQSAGPGGGAGQKLSAGGPDSDPKFKAAQDACKQFQPGGPK
ncbi:hypothetical protein [Actinomadura rupiterrae]|uniref:hypothetical protein n=1 Tax=Actinomadura rupiterrae TaxID=559627 RepID=UPI0020A4D1B9|nr:hypothetical protein [Actinomadura rupiterrae]MCP2340351.1 hypothetical protein [Actinomadura rupiterrae]